MIIDIYPLLPDFKNSFNSKTFEIPGIWQRQRLELSWIRSAPPSRHGICVPLTIWSVWTGLVGQPHYWFLHLLMSGFVEYQTAWLSEVLFLFATSYRGNENNPCWEQFNGTAENCKLIGQYAHEQSSSQKIRSAALARLQICSRFECSLQYLVKGKTKTTNTYCILMSPEIRNGTLNCMCNCNLHWCAVKTWTGILYESSGSEKYLRGTTMWYDLQDGDGETSLAHALLNTSRINVPPGQTLGASKDTQRVSFALCCACYDPCVSCVD